MPRLPILLALGGLLAGAPAFAAEPAESGAAEASDAVDAADALLADEGAQTVRFGRIALQAPDVPEPVRDMLERHARSLDLREPLTDERSHRRLLARVRRELSELLATEGYFSPKFELSVEPPAIQVQAGPRAVTGTVDIVFEGELAEAGEERAARREALRAAWR
ncbi:MAG TPA: outer membrane protein assembly factor, partial [Methyloversatilis sp.]